MSVNNFIKTMMEVLEHEDEETTNKEISHLAQVFASNAKLPPPPQTFFSATSGAKLKYYMNISTNLLIPAISKLTTTHLKRMVHTAMSELSNTIPNEADIYCIGPETAGGILVSQLCHSWNEQDEQLTPLNFIYLRKKRKTTGTEQQLEGPSFITNRTSKSALAYGIWLDDIVSTGNSLLQGKRLLRKEYNINVAAAIFLVDRSADRETNGKKSNTATSPLYHSDLADVLIGSLMDEERIKEHLNLVDDDEEDEREKHTFSFLNWCFVFVFIGVLFVRIQNTNKEMSG